MIDLCRETIIPLTVARRRLGNVHKATIGRWASTGSKGVVLETTWIGGRRCTSEEAIERFVAQLNAVSDVRPMPAQSPRRRRRQIEKAESHLAKLGVGTRRVSDNPNTEE
jgi:hypothetical protein